VSIYKLCPSLASQLGSCFFCLSDELVIAVALILLFLVFYFPVFSLLCPLSITVTFQKYLIFFRVEFLGQIHDCE
jgi:hypothetical protein